MKQQSLILGLCTTIVLSNLFAIFWGPSGITAQNTIQTQVELLNKNITELEMISQSLGKNLVQLQNSSSKLEEKAYEKGLLSTGETKIRLPERMHANKIASPGSLIGIKKNSNNNQGILRILAIILGIGVTIIWNLLFITSVDTARKKTYQGIRVQTASLK